MASAPTSWAFSMMVGDRLLDADVVDRVAVVGEDDVDQVLADVVDVALDRGQHHPALAALVGLFHVGLEHGHGRLHHLGRLEHERQLHLAGAEQLADRLHPGQQDLVDDRERAAGLHGLGQVGLQAVADPVDDAALEALVDRQGGQVLGAGRLGHLLALEQGHELLQRVVALTAPVVDQVEGDLALLVVDAVHGQDAGRGDDGRVEPGLAGLVQEHRVEHLAGGRGQAEGDVGDAQDGPDPGQLGLDPPDRLEGGHGVAPQVLLARPEREGESVEDEVLGGQAVLVDGQVVDAVGDAQLPVDVAGLALLVDQQGDQRRPRTAWPSGRRRPCGPRRPPG